MRVIHAGFILVVCLLLVISSALSVNIANAQAPAKGNIKGVIKDSTGKPVEFATVSLKDSRHSALTDESGHYSIKAAAGKYTLLVSGMGFQTVSSEISLTEGQNLELNIRLPFRVTILKEVNITASGINHDIKDVPGTVSIIDARQIKESGAQSVGQIIARVPGANYLDEDGRGLKPNIGLRGLNPIRNRNLLVLVDGKFPIGMSFYGDPAAYYIIPLENAQRIEVIKGASPVLYGGGSVGGVINVVTRKAPYKPQTTIKAAYGSFNSLTSQITTGADNGKFNYYFSALRRQGDGYRERSAFAINDYTVRFGGKPDSTSEYSVYLNAFSENSQTPGGLTQAQFDADPRQSRHTNDAFDGKRFSTAFSYNKTIAQDHKLSVSVYGNYFERNWWIANIDTTSGFLRDIHSVGTLLDYNLNKNLLNKKNSLIAGVRVHTDRLDDINAAGKTIEARTGITRGNKINTSFIYELFLYDEFSIFKNLTIAPGVRYTSVSYNRTDLGIDRIDNMDVNALVYSGGIIYKLKSHSRIFFTYSKGFQPPALNSSLAPGTIDAGVDLEPEYSDNYEAGFRSDFLKWMTFSATVYKIDFENKVVTAGGISRNIGRSYHRGIEGELEMGSWKGFSLFANGTIQKATMESGSDVNKILPNAPQQMVSSGLRYKTRIKGDLVFNIFHQYVGKQYSDEKNTEDPSASGTIGAIPAYQVVNATMNYGRKKWEVFLNINNLLNEKFYTMRLGGTPGSGWYGIIPSPSRNFMTGVTLKF